MSLTLETPIHASNTRNLRFARRPSNSDSTTPSIYLTALVPSPDQLEFAMTTASEPSVLLLDGPCAGLSPDETALMTCLVLDYQDKTGGLVIVIEHDMSIVEAISDKVLVLHQGQVLAFDSYKAVRADPKVQAVYAGATK